MGMAPILIADPDARVASLAAHGLRKEGFEVLVANRGEGALAALASFPKLILCEIGLPSVDGFVLCENVRREPATSETPFFLLAREHEHPERDRAAAVGADDLLVKPLYVRDLITLAKLFAGRRTSDRTLQGDLSELPLFYILRALTSGGRSGEVDVPQERARVRFRDGRVVDAVAGDLTGETAVARLLLLAQGPFVVKLGPVPEHGSISYSLRDLVTHDEPRRRRFERAVSLMGGPDTKLTINFSALARELPRLPPTIEKIVRLFDGERTVREALRASDLEEATTAETVLRMRMSGVLVPARVSEAIRRGDLKLFQPSDDKALPAMTSPFADSPPPQALQLPIAARMAELRDCAARPSPRPFPSEPIVRADDRSRSDITNGGEEAAQDTDPAASVGLATATVAVRAPEPSPMSSPAPRPTKVPVVVFERRASPLPAPSAEEDAFFNTLTAPAAIESSKPTAPTAPTATYRPRALIAFASIAAALATTTTLVQRVRSHPRTERSGVAAAPAPMPSPMPSLAPVLAPEPKAIPPAADAVPAPERREETPAPAVDVEEALVTAKAILAREHAPTAALDAIAPAAQAAPDDVRIQIVLALARIDAGQLEGAEGAARRALELEPKNAQAHLALGAVLQLRGERARAIAEYHAYLRLEPRGEHAAEIRAIITRER